jgi:protein gp37
MGDKSTIEWTEATWNPTTGCDRTSPGCDHCYALTLSKRLKAMGQPKYQRDGDPKTSGPGFGLTMHQDALALPRSWHTPRAIFVNSMSDLFHPDVPSDFIGAVFAIMRQAHWHTFQVLTKRPQRMERWTMEFFGAVPLNVWLGTSIESDAFTFRANHLRETPASVAFLSLEPLLGALPSLDLTGIDWVIVGGESGPGARPMHPQWARDIRDQCVAAEVPFLFKQWGEWAPQEGFHIGYALQQDGEFKRGWTVMRPSGGPGSVLIKDRCQTVFRRVGKKAAGRDLDGRIWNEYPA